MEALAPEPEPKPLRVPPVVTDVNRPFWTGGFDGRLCISRCRSCGVWAHPPSYVCRTCLSRDVRADEVSGLGVVASFTVNRQQWSPDSTADPYVVAFVELVEQPNLRLLTNIVDCAPEDVFIGMSVSVAFYPLEDVALPVFRPANPSHTKETDGQR